jgi:hypothetical protein
VSVSDFAALASFMNVGIELVKDGKWLSFCRGYVCLVHFRPYKVNTPAGLLTLGWCTAVFFEKERMENC